MILSLWMVDYDLSIYLMLILLLVCICSSVTDPMTFAYFSGLDCGFALEVHLLCRFK